MEMLNAITRHSPIPYSTPSAFNVMQIQAGFERDRVGADGDILIKDTVHLLIKLLVVDPIVFLVRLGWPG